VRIGLQTKVLLKYLLQMNSVILKLHLYVKESWKSISFHKNIKKQKQNVFNIYINKCFMSSKSAY